MTHDVPDYALVHGNPARVRGWMCQCGDKLKLAASDGDGTDRCRVCGTGYVKRGTQVSVNTQVSISQEASS